MQRRRATPWLQVLRDTDHVGNRPPGDDRDGDRRPLRARCNPGGGQKRQESMRPTSPGSKCAQVLSTSPNLGSAWRRRSPGGWVPAAAEGEGADVPRLARERLSAFRTTARRPASHRVPFRQPPNRNVIIVDHDKPLSPAGIGTIFNL
jgi:hypothetical protein